MNCAKPIRLFKNVNSPDGMLVPCGKCLLCRITKRREWSIRMLHETNYHNDNCFITLTYNDDHLPSNSSLVKSDLQKYFKRLRRDLSHTKIKYFACGEYGDNFNRPHYHAIIFGLGVKHKQIITDNWPFGFVHIGMAEPDSINYVSQYIDKKFTGPLAESEYKLKNREPVFKISSLGIGKQYALDNVDQFSHFGYLTNKGKKQSIPRYYLKQTGIDISKIREVVIENEEDHLFSVIGVHCTFDQLYRTADLETIEKVVDETAKARAQKELNATAKLSLKKRKL